MKNLRRSKTALWRKAVSGALALTAAGGMLFAAVPVALAAPAPQDDPPDDGFGVMWLEHLYAREVYALEGQTMSFDFAAEVMIKAQEWIDELAAEGEGVTDLQNALADFSVAVAEAQVSHDTAAEILRSHDGFDADGSVVDRAAAAETVRSAGRALRDAHTGLKQASVQFRRAVSDWRRAHRASDG